MRITVGGELFRAGLSIALAAFFGVALESWWPVLGMLLLWGLGCGPNDSGEGEYD